MKFIDWTDKAFFTSAPESWTWGVEEPKKLASLFSSNNTEWETPRDVFEKFNHVMRYDLDVAATAANAKCTQFFTKEDDGLSKPWHGRVWCNPPYGREIKKWTQKAVSEMLRPDGPEIISLLVPFRPDTNWFHDLYCYAHDHSREVVCAAMKRKLKFTLNGKEQGSAPFPSCIITLSRIESSLEPFVFFYSD